MAGRPKPLHESETRDMERIAAAVRFTVHFRKGPFETFTERAETLDEARAIKLRLDAAHGKNGRRAMIYAVSASGGSTPVP